MDLDPHILQVEPPEEVHKLFGCCVEWPVTKSARLVAYISLISAICNLVIMILAQNEASFSIAIDVFFLIIEFSCVLSLFYGINRKKAGPLKPFIICGVIWNAFLVLLLLFCVIQLFDQDRFTSEVLLNLSELLNFSPSNESSGQEISYYQ
ncbi:unnamed protein product [Bursaphelenchus xylophilus]|uniref:(pine wood nematode) hypothetical protein n=1 Tax=Bursaphelenchus xylophilus TaxID=6326 RepID=A0A1I7SMM0_BURXY|nr:unnamed protein product [Bursaphelenchus xylophilus]CAG9130280.1 unnamed protein product [Bursaphelenchus xylophilus]